MASATSSVTPPAIKRLQQDLKSLKESPLVGANAEPFDSDLTVWYGIIVPPESSPHSGIPLRFTLEFPNEYPNIPPKAYFDTYVAYTNGVQIKDSRGRTEVCLNIFGNFKGYHSEWGNTSEGWSPSYTVTTILVSMQGMMVDGMLSDGIEYVAEMEESAKKFRCPITHHDGSHPSKYFPQVLMSAEEAALVAARHPRVTSTPLDHHYICYANQQKNGRNSVLGYGIHVVNSRLGTLSSPCEYLSLDSFRHSGIRRSSTNLPFEHWLPILINKDDWSERLDIKKGFLVNANKICQEVKFQGTDAEKVFKVCSSLMNSLVVEIMNNGENATANDKFINGYFAIYRILLAFKKDTNLGEIADRQIGNALRGKNSLTKANFPNLGEFIIYLSISDKYGWNDVSEAFLRECDARNVFWYAKGNYNNPARYPELLNPNGTDFVGRAKKVFDATGTSRKLVMFQVRFVTVGKNLWESGVLDLDGEEDFGKFGLVPDGVRSSLKGVYQEVIGVKGWQEFFDFVGMTRRSDEARGKELAEAVRVSNTARYT